MKRPWRIEEVSLWIWIILIAKHIDIIPTKNTNIYSIIFILYTYISNINIESNIVNIIPTQIGRPNKIFKAIAEPITSYISLPIIAISVIIHKLKETFFLYPFLHNSAKLFPVTVPKFEDNI